MEENNKENINNEQESSMFSDDSLNDSSLFSQDNTENSSLFSDDTKEDKLETSEQTIDNTETTDKSEVIETEEIQTSDLKENSETIEPKTEEKSDDVTNETQETETNIQTESKNANTDFNDDIINNDINDDTKDSASANELVTVRPVKFQHFKDAVSNLSIKKNLDIMQDIPMHITVELGRTKSTIKEIINMDIGSIVELNKIAGEQVEIYVNEKLIARGEVIVIEDRFGVRVVNTNIPKDII